MSNYETTESVKPGVQSDHVDPVNYLSTYGFPKITFAYDDIHRLGSQIIHETQEAIASNGLLKWPPPSFSLGLAMIMDRFRLENEKHFFHALPINWASFHEPQITKGFEYFLREDNENGNGRRIKAFLQTFGVEAFAEQPSFQVEAEAQTENRKRIDLQICWNGPDKTKEALIIEAKFGHIVTNDQLASYVRHALKLPEINKNNLKFFVLSPGSKAQHSRAVDENKRWNEITWFQFLLSYQDILPAPADSYEFRQFRRTVWRRASS